MSDESSNPPPTLRSLSGRIDKYEIVRALGKGAMGVVYLAHDTVLERDVALKVMMPQIADDKDLHERFKREAKAVAKMTHPNVVAVFDLGQLPDGSPYIAMELLKGQDLHQARRTPPPLSLDRKVGIMVQVLAGLAHAHEAGIVHRDIKPANIFLTQDGGTKIMDFGVAHVTTASMTGTGNVVGTADYMSPEQVKGAKVDGRSDVFSVGCMLFELLADARPFHADTLMAIFYKITHTEPEWDRIPGGDAYDDLLPILQKALHKDLESRYQSAYDFAVDLRNYLVAHVTSASAVHELENLVGGGTPPPATSGVTLGVLGEVPVTRPPLQPTAVKPAGQTAERGRPTALNASVPTARPSAPAAGPASAPPRAASPTARPVRSPSPLVPRRRPAPRSRVPVYAGSAGLVLALAAVGYFWFQQHASVAPTPAPSMVPTPLPASPTPIPSVMPSPEPGVTLPTAPPPSTMPTAAPTPTPAATSPGKGAAVAAAAAQAALRKGDYALAVERAQAALRDNPDDVNTRKLLDQALLGQQAAAHLQAAETALRAGDVERAQVEADQARALAPWETSLSPLLARIAEARSRAAQQTQQQAQQQTQARVGQLLNDADAALQAQRYDDALRLYEEALKAEPGNAAARAGRTTAIGLRSAPPGRAVAGRTFVPESTKAEAGQKTADLPPGFERETTVKVQKGTQAGDLPGKIQFEVVPEGVKSGERFTVRIFFFNEGTAPIPIAGLTVATAIGGKRTGGQIAPRAKEVAPGQKVLLHEFSDLWREDYTSWAMDVAVTTVRGERYSNKLTSR